LNFEVQWTILNYISIGLCNDNGKNDMVIVI